MRNWLVIVGIGLSFTLIAQPGNKGHKGGNDHGPKNSFKAPKNSGHSKGNHTIKLNTKGNKNHKGNDGAFKGNLKGNKNMHHHDDHAKIKMHKSEVKYQPHVYQKHHAKHTCKKGHVNHVYMYSYSPFYYPTKNYGQWRSQQARNKHKSYPVVLHIDVLNAIKMIRERNAFLTIEIDHKIKRYNELVIEKHKKGLITDVQFSIHLGNIDRMKKRREHYHYDD